MIALAGKEERLNEDQARHLRITCQHIDGKLSEIEEMVDGAGSGRVYSRYSMDLSPLQKEAIMAYCSRIRSRLVTIRDEEGISGETPSISMSKAILSRLSLIDCAVEELRPKYMRGYGTVPATLVPRLNQIADDLQAPINHLKKQLEEENR